MQSEASTIAAISTAPGRSGVAVVRVSGPEAFTIARALSGRDVRPGCVMVRKVCMEECVVLAFKAPHSYTGEDVVEFQCHGGFIAPRRILDACFAAGASAAQRGEFTRRAFLNGKIGYEAAEAVIDLIDAKTCRAAESALKGLGEERKRELVSLYEEALDISTSLEHTLDVSEEEIPDSFIDGCHARIAAFASKARKLCTALNEGKLLRDGALVAILGEPNAGKSSLMNALLGENRAIVSARAGTTRDSIEEWLDIQGWPVRLADTAGLRETDDAIEAEGVERAITLASKADLVIALDPSATLVASKSNRPLVRIHSKCDISRDEAASLNVSAKTGEGLDDLKKAIASALEELVSLTSGPAAASRDERTSALSRAAACADAAAAEQDILLAANAMRSASQILADVTGSVYSSDLLDHLFSRFCVGK